MKLWKGRKMQANDKVHYPNDKTVSGIRGVNTRVLLEGALARAEFVRDWDAQHGPVKTLMKDGVRTA